MRSFMTSRSLTWGAELDEEPDGSDMTPFPKEKAVMRVYRGPPPPPLGRHRMSSGWGHRGSGV
jgi:hypothetical protein